MLGEQLFFLSDVVRHPLELVQNKRLVFDQNDSVSYTIIESDDRLFGDNDIYFYIAEAASEEKIELFNYVKEINPNADVFEVILRITRQSLEPGDQKPGYAELGLRVEWGNSETAMKMRKSSMDKFIKFVFRRGICAAEKDRGPQNAQADSSALLCAAVRPNAAPTQSDGEDAFVSDFAPPCLLQAHTVPCLRKTTKPFLHIPGPS